MNMQEDKSIIEVSHVSKFFGEKTALDDVTLNVKKGEFVTILGPSGCGKTTLFRILTGEIGYDEGEVFVNPNKKLGLISQIPRYPIGYTVEDVLRSAFAGLLRVKSRMEELEAKMTASAPKEILNEYDRLSNRFAAGGGGVTGQAMGKPQETVGRKAMGATAFRRYASPAAGIFASAFWQRKGEI